MYACSVRPTVTYGYKGFIHSIVYSCVKDRQTDRHTNIEEAESDIKSNVIQDDICNSMTMCG